MNKRALLISSYYYPCNAPGCHRCAKLAKYLPKFGWSPVVLCADATPENSRGMYDPQLEGRDPCETIRVPWPYRPGRSLRNWFNWYVVEQYAITYSPWGLYRRMLKRGRELARREPFDVIWATCPATVVLSVAGGISRACGIPWVADMRDLTHETLKHPGPFCRWRMWLEEVACRSAAAIITVTPQLADRLAKLHTMPIHVVPNGFDPDDFPPAAQQDSDHFDIVYCGSIYGGRDPSPLFDALDAMLTNGSDDISRLRVRFYGVLQEQLDAHLAGRPCAGLVENMGRVPFGEMVGIQQRASVLLLLTHPGVAGIMTSKVFEYLAAGRTILSVPGDSGVTDALLEETRAGVIGRTAHDIAGLLRDRYGQWRDTGVVQYRGLPDKIARYTREKQAERTAEVLTSVCE